MHLGKIPILLVFIDALIVISKESDNIEYLWQINFVVDKDELDELSALRIFCLLAFNTLDIIGNLRFFKILQFNFQEQI